MLASQWQFEPARRRDRFSLLPHPSPTDPSRRYSEIYGDSPLSFFLYQEELFPLSPSLFLLVKFHSILFIFSTPFFCCCSLSLSLSSRKFSSLLQRRRVCIYYFIYDDTAAGRELFMRSSLL